MVQEGPANAPRRGRGRAPWVSARAISGSAISNMPGWRSRPLDLEPENPDALLGLAQCELNEFTPVPESLLHGGDEDTDPASVEEKMEAAAETYTAAVQRAWSCCAARSTPIRITQR